MISLAKRASKEVAARPQGQQAAVFPAAVSPALASPEVQRRFRSRLAVQVRSAGQTSLPRTLERFSSTSSRSLSLCLCFSYSRESQANIW